MELTEVQRRVLAFAQERGWEHHHTPKNLVMALTGEVGELNEVFQWLTPEQAEQIMDDPASAQAASDEIVDVLNYALALAARLGIDLDAAIESKLARNAAKYPVGGDESAMRGVVRKPAQVSNGSRLAATPSPSQVPNR